MAYDERLAERIRECLARRKQIEMKKMFGGAVFLLRGHMLVGVWEDALVARVGLDGYEDALLEPHVKEFNVTGKPMKRWVLVGPEGVEDEGQLRGWIERASRFVATLPAK